MKSTSQHTKVCALVYLCLSPIFLASFVAGSKIDQHANQHKGSKHVEQHLSCEDKLNAFVEWLNVNGAKFDKVRVSVSAPLQDQIVPGPSSGPGCHYSVFAKDKIENGESLIEIPFDLLLNIDHAVRDPTIGHILSKYVGDFLEKSILAIYLLYQQNQPNSYWRPYIDLLPTELDTPMFWTDEELALLEGSWTKDRLEADRNGLLEEYHYVMDELEKYPKDFSRSEFTVERFLWAWGIIWSRAFVVSHEQVKSALVPLADLFNHKNDAKTTFGTETTRLDEIVFKMKVEEEYQPSSEIFNNYTPRSNSELLRLFGFILPNNKMNRVALSLSLKETDEENVLQFKEKVIEYNDLATFEYPYSDTQHFVDVDGVPKKVMDFLTVKHYRPNEKEVHSKNVGVKVTTLAKNDPICEQNALIELQNLLNDLLNRYPSTIQNSQQQEDTQLLTQKLDRRTRMAVQVRLQEKNILDKALTTINGFLVTKQTDHDEL